MDRRSLESDVSAQSANSTNLAQLQGFLKTALPGANEETPSMHEQQTKGVKPSKSGINILSSSTSMTSTVSAFFGHLDSMRNGGEAPNSVRAKATETQARNPKTGTREQLKRGVSSELEMLEMARQQQCQ